MNGDLSKETKKFPSQKLQWPRPNRQPMIGPESEKYLMADRNLASIHDS
jgi:hypothetical protein